MHWSFFYSCLFLPVNYQHKLHLWYCMFRVPKHWSYQHSLEYDSIIKWWLPVSNLYCLFQILTIFIKISHTTQSIHQCLNMIFTIFFVFYQHYLKISDSIEQWLKAFASGSDILTLPLPSCFLYNLFCYFEPLFLTFIKWA